MLDRGRENEGELARKRGDWRGSTGQREAGGKRQVIFDRERD